MIEKILKLEENTDLIMDSIFSKNPDFKIEDVVSIYVYGSYVYGYKDYIPDDIDLGIVVKGSKFLYSLDKILVSKELKKRLNTYAKHINYFVYGEDNMTLNSPVDDTLYAGVVHKHTTQHEISVSYQRNIVLYGKDFCYIENNTKNTYHAIYQTLLKCKARIDRYGNYSEESDSKCLKKIATRLYELNIFLHIFEPCYNVVDESILTLPTCTLNGLSSIEEMRNIFHDTENKYNNIIFKK